MEVRATMADTGRWPRVEVQPSVRSHQEGAYRRPIHYSVGLPVQPVVIPADSLRLDVEDRVGTEVQFARLALAGICRPVDPGSDDQALGTPGRLRAGVGLQTLEHPQRAAQ